MLKDTRRYGINKAQTQRPRARWIALLALLIIVAIGISLLISNHRRQTASKTPSIVIQKKIPSGTQNGKHSISTGAASQGGAIDKKGQTTSTTQQTSESQWATASSGAITLKQPVANQTLKSGDTIRGTATVDTVQYRLVDDTRGMLAQGELSVNSGTFSGVLQFQPFGTTGKLEVFSFDAQSGAEVNRITIPIKLSR